MSLKKDLEKYLRDWARSHDLRIETLHLEEAMHMMIVLVEIPASDLGFETSYQITEYGQDSLEPGLKRLRERHRRVIEEMSVRYHDQYMEITLEFAPEIKVSSMHRVADVPAKYEHIDFTPPQGVADAAERGLELRREQTGDKAGLTPAEAAEEGIGSGVQRAVNLKNRDTISPEVIGQMVGFFARHGKNIAKARKLKTREEQIDSNMYVSDLLWGGEPGEKWANRIKDMMEAADEKEKQSKAARRIAERILEGKNLPPTVEKYVKEHLDDGMDEGYAWAVAWSRYCEFSNPDSPHCKSKDYFHGKGKQSSAARVAARFLEG